MKSSWKKIFFYFFFLGGAAFLVYAGFFVYKINSVSKKITLTPQEKQENFLETAKNLVSKDLKELRGEKDGRINILLLGIAGSGKPGQYLTDTIILASFNTQTHQTSLLSLPRDMLVNIPESQTQTKINSVYQLSLKRKDSDDPAKDIKKTVHEITGQEIHYCAVLNFDGFIKAIDAIDGVNITNERDIYDARYPGPNYSYETFELKKGFHQLDGQTALKYARERHDDPQGDFGRAKRQQQIMQAAKNKIFSKGTMLNVLTLNDLINIIGENLRTDIRTEELESFLELTKKLDTQNINTVVVDAWNRDSLLKVSHTEFGGQRAFVLIPRVGNYSEIQELAQNIFDLEKIKRRKESIAKEEASVAIINQSDDAKIIAKIQNLLRENFGYKKVDTLKEKINLPSEKTLVYDRTNGTKPFTLDELILKLPASASYEIPSAWQKIMSEDNYDMLIVIGKDLVPRYNMEEDSFEDYKNAKETDEYTEFLEQPKS